MIIRRMVLTGAMCCMLLGGCGKNDVDMISDYGSEKVAPQEIRITEENERDAVVNPGSEAEAHELFGEGTVKWNETFTAYDEAVQCNIDVEFERILGKYLPTYKCIQINSESFHEEEIVQNLFGENARKRTDLVLTQDNGDSYKLMQSITGFLYSAGEIDVDETAITPWIEKDNYFVHTYEGIYRNSDCQLAIGYSSELGKAYLAMYAKNPGEMIGHPEYGAVEASGVVKEYCGPVYSMVTYEEDSKKAMPNNCNLSQEEQLEKVNTFMKDYLLLDCNPDSFSTSNFGYIGMNIMNDEPNEAEYYSGPDHMYRQDDDGLLEKNGYYITLADNFGGIYTEGWPDHGGFYVDDQGVVSFDLFLSEILTDKISEDTDIIDYENLQKCLKDAIVAKADSEKVKAEKLYFTEMKVIYSMVQDESDPNTGEMVPTLVLSATEGVVYKMQVYINMVDGSLMDVKY